MTPQTLLPGQLPPAPALTHRVVTSQGRTIYVGSLPACQAYVTDEESCMVRPGWTILPNK